MRRAAHARKGDAIRLLFSLSKWRTDLPPRERAVVVEPGAGEHQGEQDHAGVAVGALFLLGV